MNSKTFDLDVVARVEIDKVAEVFAYLPSTDQAEFFNAFFEALHVACDRSHFKTQTQLLHVWDGLDEPTRQKLEFMTERATS